MRTPKIVPPLKYVVAGSSKGEVKGREEKGREKKGDGTQGEKKRVPLRPAL